MIKLFPMKKLLLLPLIFMFLFTACPKEEEEEPPPPPPPPKNAIDLLPRDNEISGWTKSEAIKTAETAEQLTALIDGEAVPYINNNFKEAVFQKYSGTIGSNTIPLEVRVFDMRDSINARNVYKDVGTGSETPWTDNPPGVEARINDSFLFSYMVEFREDKFYLRIVIDEKSSTALDITKLFAHNISAAIKE